MAKTYAYAYTKESLVEVVKSYCEAISNRADEFVGEMNGLRSMTFTIRITMDELPNVTVEKELIERHAIAGIK